MDTLSMMLRDEKEEDEKEAAAGGEASKAPAVAHVVYRAADITIHFLCILCIAGLAISAWWCIQWMRRARELPASIPPAMRRNAFAKRLARRRASRVAKRAAAAAEWAQFDEALAAAAFSRLDGSPSVPCSPCSPRARLPTLLSHYVDWLRALGRERHRKTQPGCRLRSYLRRRHRKMILRKAKAAFSPSPPSPGLAEITGRPAVVTPEMMQQSAAALAALELRARLARTADAPRQVRSAVDLRVRHLGVSVVRLRGGMQAAAPDADAAAAAMSSAMSELDVAAATPVRLATSSELIDRLRLRFHIRRNLQLRRHL